MHESSVGRMGRNQPSIFEMMEGSSRRKKELARALTRNMVADERKDELPPTIAKTEAWNKVENWKENINKKALGDDNMTDIRNEAFLRERKEKGHILNRNELDAATQVERKLKQVRSTRRRSQNAVDDECIRKRLLVSEIDLLPSRVDRKIIDARCRVQKTEEKPKNDRETRLQTDAATRRESPPKDVDNVTFGKDATFDPPSSQHGLKQKAFPTEDFENVRHSKGGETVDPPSRQSRLKQKTIPTEDFESVRHSKGRGIMQDEAPNAKKREDCRNKIDYISGGDSSSKDNCLHLLNSLKQLIRKRSNSPDDLKANLSKRNSIPLNARYQHINTRDMTSPADFENELKKLSNNLSDLNTEISDIKVGVQERLIMVTNMLKLEK